MQRFFVNTFWGLAVVLPWLSPHIAVVGDVMLDEYLDGSVTRISPEAPVPILAVEKQFSVPGGAANAACGVQDLGGTTHLYSVIGVDDTAMQLQLLLKRAGVKGHFITTSARPTTRKTRIVSGNHQLCRVDRESASALPESVRADLKTLVTGIGTCSAVLLSDYGKGCLSADLIAVILEIGLQKQIPVVIDPKGRDYTKYASATIITPNYKEACESLGVAESEKIPGSELGQVLLEKFGFQYVLVTLGADGMVLVRKGKKPLHLPAVAHEVFDVSGAGDTVAAVITLCLSCKLPIEEAVRLANLAAGIAVTKQGTQTVSRKELMREVKKERSLFNQVKTFFSGI